LLSFFFYFSFFNGSEASNICQLSVIVCPFFFWRIFAKRIEPLSGDKEKNLIQVILQFTTDYFEKFF